MPRRRINRLLTWKERRTALRYIPPFLKLVWSAHRGYTIAMAGLRVIRAFLPVSALFIAKLIIDTVVHSRTNTPDFPHLWKLVAVEIVIVILSDVLSRSSALIESLLGDLFSTHTSVRLMAHSATLDLHHFENAQFYDQLERARRQTTGRLGLLN